MKPLKLYVYLILVILYIPIVAIIIQSFNDTPYVGEWKGFTTRWYRVILSDSQVWSALKNSIIVATLSAAISIILSLPAVAAEEHYRRRTRDTLVYMPIIMPEIVEAIALLLFFIYIGFPLGVLSVLIGHTAFNVAYAYVTLEPVASKARTYFDVARTLGATPLKAFQKAVVRVIAPAVIAAAAIAFTMSFTDFIKTLFTTGPGFYTLPLIIWNRARRPGLTEYSSINAVNALASIIIISTLTASLIYLAYISKTKKRTIY